MRVCEYARSCGIKSKELIRILDEIGIYNKTPQSNITEEEIKKAQVEILSEDNPFPVEEKEINSNDFYDVDKELLQEYPMANYAIAISPRGLGKSTNAILLILREYINTGCPSVLIRRREVDVDGGKLAELFGEIIALGYIKSWSGGRWSSVKTVGMRSYLCNVDEDGKIIDRDKTFFMYCIPLSESANYKGIQLNKSEENIFVKYIVYDELMPVDNNYLPNESSLFFNAVSTIIRHFDKAKIIMLGNTIVTSLNPILATMGIDILSFAMGEKRLYKYDAEDEKDVNFVVVHKICKKNYKGVANKNNKYFNFNNKSLSSITGEDSEYDDWEISRSFNGKPRPYCKDDIINKFFWIYSGEIYQADVVVYKGKNERKSKFIFCHKTGHKYDPNDEWLNSNNEIVFSTIYDPRPNWINKLSAGCKKFKRVKKICELISDGKIYYQNAWLSLYFTSLLKEM